MDSGSIQFSNEEMGCYPGVRMEIEFLPGQETLSVHMRNLPKEVWNIFLSEEWRKKFNKAFPPLSKQDGKEEHPYGITLLVYPGEMNMITSVIRGVINPHGFEHT